MTIAGLTLRAGVATDPGRMRTSNQDRYVVVDERLFAVADGMGGHRGGEVAAQIVTDGLRAFATEDRPIGVDDVRAEVERLNTEVLRASVTSEELLGMGTTLTMLVATVGTDSQGPGSVPLLLVVNVGDSRTYLLRNGELIQLTEDHSVVADLVREGSITADEARTHRQRSVITRAMGVDTGPGADFIEIIPAPRSRFLLCSDGLSNEVPDDLIATYLRRLADPGEAARELVRVALERGGRDNVTAVIVDVGDGPDVLAASASSAIPATAHAADDATRVVPSSPLGIDAPPLSAPPKRTKGPKTPKVRHPWPINLRVLLFFVLLAGLAGAVWVILKNAPDASTPTAPTTLITTTDPPTATTALTATTGVDTTAVDATDSDSAPLVSLLPTTTTLGPIGPSTTINDFAPGPEPSTTSP